MPYGDIIRGRTYQAYKDAKKRCRKPSHPAYKNYGGRGIKMCAGLAKTVKNFISAVGLKPDRSLQLDRTDNDGHYSCGECEECIMNNWPMNLRWITRPESNANRRGHRRTRFITYEGQRLCMAEWARRKGISYATLGSRIRSGWTPAQAMDGSAQDRRKAIK